jgi:hypothetical protein
MKNLGYLLAAAAMARVGSVTAPDRAQTTTAPVELPHRPRVGEMTKPIACAVLDKYGCPAKLLWTEALTDTVHGDMDIEFPTGAPHRTIPLYAVESDNALETVRSMIKPDSILVASEIRADRFPRKAIFNALTYLTKTGELVRIGYGRYQSPPSDLPALESNPK